MARDTASRASMDYSTMQKEGASTSARRRATVHEAMRKTAGADAVRHWAEQNANILPEESFLNVDMVNDGNQGFRAARSIEEVVAYGDAREARVAGLREGNRVAVTVVGHLPTALCEEVPDAYDVRDEDGRVVGKRERLVARDRAEAIQYFNDWIDFQAEKLPGGRDAIHGYSINFDEDRPHIQLLADPFEEAPTAKDPTRLKNGFSRAFGSHPADRLVEVTTRDGSTKRVREGASRKMERYQQELKEHMAECGWQVELERDPVRHARKESQHRYKENREAARAVAAREEVLDGREAALTAREKAVAEAEAEIPAMRAKARREGREEGRAEGLAGAKEEREALLERARHEVMREKMETARRAAAAAAEIERKARERAAATLEEAVEAADQVIRAQIDAAEREIAEEKQAAAENLKDYVSALFVDVAKKLPPPAGCKGENAYEVIKDKVNTLVEKELPGATKHGRMARIRETLPERAARRNAEVMEAVNGAVNGAVNEESQAKTQEGYNIWLKGD